METTFLVEIRLARTKWRIRESVSEIDRRYDLGDSREVHPHVTLFGPFSLNEGITSRELLDAIGRVAAGYDPVSFLIDGWERRDGTHGSVIAFPVHPSDPLCRLTRDVAGALTPLTCSQNVWDLDPEKKWFHVTIANRLSSDRASAIHAGIIAPDITPVVSDPAPAGRPGILKRLFATTARKQPTAGPVPPVLLDEDGIRITIMRDSSILAEYDLVEHRWIYQDHSHSSARWQTALARFRVRAGLERRDPVHPRADDIFLTADLHLGHANIIRYCSRPFLWSDVEEMDHVLIKNWNYTVTGTSRIYCLGDLRYGADAAPAARYRKRLRGDIVMVAGNHDRPDDGAIPSARITFAGEHFFLVHDPGDAPSSFNGWVIHGHHHNNDLRHFPFINFDQQRINVSVEVTRYMPVGLQEILGTIRARTTAGDTTPILLRETSGPP